MNLEKIVRLFYFVDIKGSNNLEPQKWSSGGKGLMYQRQLGPFNFNFNHRSVIFL